jgi:hypothetical protein
MTTLEFSEIEEKLDWLADRLWEICQPPGCEEEFAPLLEDRYRTLAELRQRFLPESGGEDNDK